MREAEGKEYEDFAEDEAAGVLTEVGSFLYNTFDRRFTFGIELEVEFRG